MNVGNSTLDCRSLFPKNLEKCRTSVVRIEPPGVTPEADVEDSDEPELINDNLFFLPVHLGTQEIPKALTETSLLEASRRRYHGPSVIVRKPNGSIRVTHDFSGLKAFTTLF
eukprot:GHVP01066596.1.p2 GENE.GHVP01066596.1~~GHVP01066596.1.p2  ORF type:complete len:112 (-),score=7.85 GHVP01066596.1:595-930(-)